MNDLRAIVESDVDWLSALPLYQQEIIRELGKTRDFEDVARAWLEAGTASDTVGFGARESARVFYDALRNKMHDALCSDDKFIEERRKLLDEYKAGQTTVAAYIATVLSPHLGTAAPILTAAVVLTLSVIKETGLEAWCQQQTERRRPQRPPDDASPGENMS